MQLHIDPYTEHPTVLRQIAGLLMLFADLRDDPIKHIADGEAPLPPDTLHARRTGAPHASDSNPFAVWVSRWGGTAAPSTAAAAPTPIVPAPATAIPAPSIPPPPSAPPPVSVAPPPVVAVPSPPASSVSVVPAPPVSGELDSSGLPYDARIHNHGRTKKIDGTWKLIKGIDKALAAQIEAELRGTAIAAIPAPGTTVAPPPPASVAAVPPAALFAALMKRVTAGISSGKVTQGKINEAALTLGVTNLMQFHSRSDLLPLFNTLLDGVIAP